MSAPLDTLLDRLADYGPSPRGPGKYMSRCPAHDDRSRSLAITERQDGAILLHCFAGCEVSAIIEKLNLSIVDLFPDDFSNWQTKQKLPYQDGIACLKTLKHEIDIIYICCSDFQRGVPMSRNDAARFRIAANRIIRVFNDMGLA